MKEIKMLVENIHDEAEDAEKYAKLAVKYRDMDKEMSDVFAYLSEEELSHLNKLHAQAVRYIRKAQDSGAEVPAAMQAVWDWEHTKNMEHVAKVKMLLSTLKA